ncbi:MAG: hypothetical protein IKF71_03290 [Bacilli bacterium]|nr:hypothetical protein [Bacilli bacterium]
MKKKKNQIIKKQSLKKFLAILVVFLLVFGIGYILGIGSMNMVPNLDIQEYKKITEVEDERVKNLVDTLMAGGDCWNVEDYANDHKVDVKNIPDERLYQVVQWGSFYKKGPSTVPLNDFIAEMKNYFSIGFNFDPSKINKETCNPYSYNEEKQEFVALKIACIDQCGPNRTLYKIMDVEDNGFDLKVTVNVLFGSQAESVHYYADYERLQYITDDYENIDQYFDQGNSYLFTFLRVDEKYLFVSSERI